MSAKVIDSGQLEDFRQGTKQCGCDPDDFGISTSDGPHEQLGDGTHVIRQRIKIVRRSTNVMREYKGGNASTWAAEAIADVQAGRFDKR